MNDDMKSRDERIADAARELYHPPPATPRAEMWKVIRARLDESSAGGGAANVTPLRVRAPRGRIGWWIGIAAALVIGLGIGRLTTSNGPAGETPVRMAEREAPAGQARDSIAAPTGAPPADSAAVPGDRLDDSVATVAGGTDPQGRRDVGLPRGPVAEDRPIPERAPRSSDRTGVRGEREDVAYAVAARQHLDRSESLLTGVRTALETGEPDPRFETWALSLLSRTRLLLGSPAARDPATRRLLEDLELMLVQIVFTTATGDPGEERILGEGLQDGDLLYRLRSATQDEIRPGDDRAARTSSL